MEKVDRKTGKRTIVSNPRGANFLYGTIIGRILLKLITHKVTANIVRWHFDRKWSKPRIKRTIKENNMDMSIYEDKDYQSFNEFFLRRKKNLNFDMKKDDFVSPCDSKVMVYKLSKNSSFDIKGSIYSVNEIIEKDLSNYENGYALIFRLEVSDYHHYHFIDNGTLDDYKYIKGCLHAVLPIALKKYKIFHTNSREYTTLHTENFGDVIEVDVGALNVGRIVNDKSIKKYKRGDEKGRFEFGGSTIILFVKENKVIIDNDILLNSTLGRETIVSCGEKIGIKVK